MFTRHTVNTPYAVGPVHLYVFERGGDLVLFDSGPPTLESFDYIRNNIELEKLSYVFITHSHADHCGGLKFISEHSNARLCLPKKDILKDRLFEKTIPVFKNTFASLGFPEEAIAYMFDVLYRFKEDTKIPMNVEAVENIKLPDGISFKPFPGHSISDIVYFVDERYAITGDFLLSNIFQTPLMEVDPETKQVFNNYEAYCMSIRNIDLFEGLEILPSHSEVNSIKEVVSFYVEKILKRSEFTVECLRQSCTIFDAVSKLSDPFKDPFKTFVKTSELLFFRSFAKNPFLLEDSLEKIGLIDKFADSFKRFALH